MAIRFLLVLTCLSLACCLVWAKPAEILVRAEESRWIAEVIGTASDGWPEVLSRQSYLTREQAMSRKVVLLEKFRDQIEHYSEVSPQVAKGVLWSTTQSWSNEWEHKYAKWIESEVDTEFFVRYKVATDCADVAYSLRWIFSRIHGLPAAATLGDGKIFMNNEMVRSQWASLPTSANWYEDRRFLAALNYLLDMTYTHSLWADSYPVALNKESLISGSYHLNLHDNSGHTQVIHWMDSDAGVPFLTLNSTVPRKVRSLSDWMLSAGPSVAKKSGLLRFRWAVKNGSSITLKNPTEMPGYSLEQFSFKPQKDFSIALFEKLGYTGGKEGIREYLYKDLISQFKARIDIVKEGVQKCAQDANACKPGTPAWDDWSTPSRDSRIKGKIASLVAVEEGATKSPKLEDVILDIENTPWTLGALIWNWNNDEFSSDPQVSEIQRWGAGGPGWGQAQIQFFKTKLQERQEVLLKGAKACTGKDCRFGTAAWKSTSSNAIDIALGKKALYLKNGRGVIPKAALNELDAKGLQSLITIQGFGINLPHILDFQVGMNSSAMATVEEQWALGPWKAISLTGMPNFVKNKYLIDFVRSGGGVLWDLETGKKVQLPFSILADNGAAGVFLIREGAALSLYELESGNKKSMPSEWEVLSENAFSFNGKLFSVQLADRLQVYSLLPKTLDLQLFTEVAGSKWSPIGAGLFKQDNVIFDALTQLQIGNINSSMTLCVSDDFAFLLGQGAYVLDRKAGKGIKFEVTALTSGSCERRELMTLEPQGGSNYKSVILSFDVDLQSHRGQEFEGMCSFVDQASVVCGVNKHILENGKWRKIDSTATRYSVKNVAGKGLELVENSSGKTLFAGYFMSLLQDRYLAILETEGESVQLLDLQRPEYPSVTNAVLSQYGVGISNFGKYFAVTGYLAGTTSSILWRA